MEQKNDFISSINSITSLSELRNRFISFYAETKSQVQQLTAKYSDEHKQKDEQITKLQNTINGLESTLGQNDRDGIEKHTNMLLSTFTDCELNELKQTLQCDIDENPDKSEQYMNWNNVFQCVKQQMWPKLSSAIESIVHNVKMDSVITDESIDIIINELKEKRHLPTEERQYLRKLIHRTRNFTQFTNNHNKGNNIALGCNFVHEKIKGLTSELLMDIFHVHK
eukprot:330068_1